MKKLLALLLALTIALSLAACGGSGNNGSGNQTDNTNAANDAADNEADRTPEEDQADSPAEEPETPENEEPAPEDGAGQETGDGEDTEASGDADAPEEEAVGASHSDVTFSAAGSSFRLVPTGDTENVTAVTYTTADETIAAVGEDGTVTAVAPGTTTVTMTLTEGGETFSFDCIIRCSWQETSEQAPAEGETDGTEDSGETAAQSLADFYAGLQENYDGLGMMTAYEGELLDNYYPGLSDIAVEEILIQETAMTMANSAVALVHVTDSADVETVKSILAARAQTQADGGAWYPASCETWPTPSLSPRGTMWVCLFTRRALRIWPTPSPPRTEDEAPRAMGARRYSANAEDSNLAAGDGT